MPATEYPLLSRSLIVKYLPVIDAQGVSMVARGFRPSTQTNKGFLSAFFNRQLDEQATKNSTWLDRRRGFIARHYRPGRRLFKEDGSPTRLHLALIAWAYSPEPDKLKSYARKEKLNNRLISQYVSL